MKAADYSAAFNCLKTTDSVKVRKKHDTVVVILSSKWACTGMAYTEYRLLLVFAV